MTYYELLLGTGEPDTDWLRTAQGWLRPVAGFPLPPLPSGFRSGGPTAPFRLDRSGRREFRLLTPFSPPAGAFRYLCRNGPRRMRVLQGTAAQRWACSLVMPGAATLGPGPSLLLWEYQGPFGTAGAGLLLEDPLAPHIRVVSFTKALDAEGRAWTRVARVRLSGTPAIREVQHHLLASDEASIAFAYSREP